MYKQRKYLILITLEDLQSDNGEYFYNRLELKKITAQIKSYTSTNCLYYELNDIRLGILETEALYKEQCYRYIESLNTSLHLIGYKIHLKSIALEMPDWRNELFLQTLTYRDLIEITKELFSKDIFIKKYYTRQEFSSIIRLYLYGLSKDIFSVYSVIQPKINICDKKCIGGEVLSRIKEFNVKSSLNIEQIVIILVKLELIKELDKLSLQTTLAYISDNASSIKDKNIRISSNLSLLHFTKDSYVTEVEKIVETFKPSIFNCLDIEITEYNNFTARIIKNINTLIRNYKDKIQFHLDDVYSINGFTSVDIITRTSIDKIKLDREILTSAKSRKAILKIMSGIKMFADNYGTGIICEGVETKAHESILKEVGIKEAQGYLYSRPIPLNEFKDKYLRG